MSPNTKHMAMDEDIGYPIDMHQGWYATNPVPRFSVLAGRPVDPPRTEEDDRYRTKVLRRFVLGYLLAVAVAIALAFWRRA